MSDFLVYAARLQDAGISSLWVSLGSNVDHIRLMHVSPDASVSRDLAAKFPTRTFELCGTDRVLERLKDDMTYSDTGVTAEKVQAAIDAHPLLREDLTEWLEDSLLLQMPTPEEVAAEQVDEDTFTRTAQYAKGLMRGIDILRARKAMRSDCAGKSAT